MERLMEKNKWILALVVLLLGVLACASPDTEGSPSLAGTITHEGGTPVAQIDAVEAIQVYALDILGIDIPKLKAGGTSGEINLPISAREGVEVAIDLAGTTYFGIWGEGFASLSMGDSSVSGDLFADVQDGSLGAFIVRVDQDFPTDAATALGMILTTYPGLNGYEFYETPVEEQGYEFTAGQADDIHLQAWEVTLTGTSITAGVRPGFLGGKSHVWVVVASGALATPINGK
jgi:hypothetical protein